MYIVFLTGHFAELELHKSVYGPSVAVFFPSFTLLGSQVQKQKA